MSTSKSNKNRICRQSSEIELKTIVNDNTVSLLDAEKAAIKSDEQNNVNCEQSNGINIKFQDIIYRARRNFIWDRCKCQISLKWILAQNVISSSQFSSHLMAVKYLKSVHSLSLLSWQNV